MAEVDASDTSLDMFDGLSATDVDNATLRPASHADCHAWDVVCICHRM